MKSRLTSALAWSAAEAFVNVVSALIVIFYVAHKVGPTAFGIASIVIVICSIGEAVVSTPFMEAIVQKKELDSKLADVLFTVMLTGGIAVYFVLIVVLYSYSISSANSEILHLGYLQAIGVLMIGARGCQEALLARNLQFRALALRSISAKLIGTVASIVLAHFDYGAWALVVGNLAFATMATVFVIAASEPRKLNFEVSYLKPIFSFSMWNMMDVLLTVLTPRLFGYCVAWKFGAEKFGQLSVAFRICDSVVALMASVVTRLALPLLSRNSEEKSSLIMLWTNGTRAVALGIVPVFIGLSLVSDRVVNLFLGPQWELAATSLSILSIYYLFNFLAILVQPTIKAKGRTSVLSLVHMATITVILSLFSLLSSWGFTAAILAYPIGGFCLFLFGTFAVYSIVGIELRTQVANYVKPAISAIVMCVCVKAVNGYTAGLPDLTAIFIEVLVGCVSYVVPAAILDRKLVLEFVGRARTSKSA